MALPSSGALSLSQIAVELNRAANARTSLGEAAVRTLAGVPSGAIGMADLRGKSAALVFTASTAASLDLATAFGSDYAGAVAKKLVVPGGVILGPVMIPAGMGGDLVIENAGEIQGTGGAANGGAGGDAITSHHSFTLLNTGAVRGGGGGGGLGGAGGQGTALTTVRDPASGERYSTTAPVYYWIVNPASPSGPYWNGALVQSVSSGATQVTVGDTTYSRGALQATDPPKPYRPYALYAYALYRSYATTSFFAGGAGGTGGRGRGYGQPLADGAAGAPGGTNAGTGGAGGDGGDWAQDGGPGASGANGNHTSGAAGSPGGTAGRAVRMLAGSLTLTNSGTINGAA
jgi:hypothetical protein